MLAMMESPSLSVVLAAVAATLVIAYGLLRPVYNYVRDPLDLRKYSSPNVWAAIWPFWLMWETWNQRRSATIHECHKRLGDIVRVGPNLVLLNTPQAVADIYGHLAARKIEKDVFYDKMSADGFHDVVTTRKHEDHSRKRRYMANSFALKTVVDMEPVIRENCARLLGQIDRASEQNLDNRGFSAPFNIRQWLNYFTLDVIGDMAFGTPLGFLTNGSDHKSAQTQNGHTYEVGSMIEALHQGVRHTLTLAQIVSLPAMKLAKRLTRCTNYVYRSSGAKSADDFENIAIDQLRARLSKGRPDRPSGDFVSNILLDRSGEKRDLPFMELVAESVVLLNAGSDTTAASLTNTLYQLMSNPQCLAKLRDEVSTRISPDDAAEIIPYNTVRDLPYLRACIDESLRLRPPIAYPLQRLVVAPEGAVIDGHHFRQGTVVAVPPFSIHRKESLFPNAESYNPDRWLDELNPEQIQALKSCSIPFSMGPRACLGRHVAIVELQIVISSLVRRYDFEFAHSKQELKIFERFNSNPGPMPVRLRRRFLANDA